MTKGGRDLRILVLRRSGIAAVLGVDASKEIA